MLPDWGNRTTVYLTSLLCIDCNYHSRTRVWEGTEHKGNERTCLFLDVLSLVISFLNSPLFGRGNYHWDKDDKTRTQCSLNDTPMEWQLDNKAERVRQIGADVHNRMLMSEHMCAFRHTHIHSPVNLTDQTHSYCSRVIARIHYHCFLFYLQHFLQLKRQQLLSSRKKTAAVVMSFSLKDFCVLFFWFSTTVK